MSEAPRLYLASRSERRGALLRQLGITFEELRMRESAGRARDVVERVRPEEAPVDYVKRIARTKAAVGWHFMRRRQLTPLPVLGADTEVIMDDGVLGKPADAADAVAMLLRLSGRTHQVATTVAVRWNGELLTATSVSRVSFRTASKDEIERYVATGEPFGKAGAYAIQGRGALFIQHLEGSYSGVMGLPLFETGEILGRIGYPVL